MNCEKHEQIIDLNKYSHQISVILIERRTRGHISVELIDRNAKSQLIGF